MEREVKMQLLKKLLIIPIILFASSVYGDDSPRLLQYPPNKVMSFLGLDTRSSAPLIGDGRAEDLLNVKLSSRLNLKKRDGYAVINDTLDDLDIDSPAITGIFDAQFSDDSQKVLAFVGNKLKYDDGSAWTTVTGFGLVTAGQNNQWTCTMALDTAICTNDVDQPVEVSSTPTTDLLTTTDLSDSLDKAKDVIFFRNYLIFVNTVEAAAEKPQRFRWSNVGTAETWSDNDFVDVGTLAGDEIVGVAELHGNLYLFLKKSIFRVTLIGGNDVFSFNKIIDGIGAIARDSIVNVRLPNDQLGIIFISENKRIYFFNGVNIVDIGGPIQPTLNNLNEARLQYAVGVWDDQDYFLAISDGGSSTNNLVLNFQTELGEWTKHDQIDANAIARVKTNSLIKTYFGNYKAFVYWMDDPDRENDIDGASGVVESAETVDTATITGAQLLVDTDLTSGNYTGATIKITSGTAAGEEAVITTMLASGLIVSNAFTTTPDSTSNYSIGAIDSQYTSKWYDFGASSRKKNFKHGYFWAKEESTDEVTVSYAVDFGTTISSEEKTLAPTGSSVWDTALWDEGTWGTTGDRFETIKLNSVGRYVQIKFANSDIDEDFEIYGFHLLADALDVR